MRCYAEDRVERRARLHQVRRRVGQRVGARLLWVRVMVGRVVIGSTTMHRGTRLPPLLSPIYYPSVRTPTTTLLLRLVAVMAVVVVGMVALVPLTMLITTASTLPAMMIIMILRMMM